MCVDLNQFLPVVFITITKGRRFSITPTFKLPVVQFHLHTELEFADAKPQPILTQHCVPWQAQHHLPHQCKKCSWGLLSIDGNLLLSRELRWNPSAALLELKIKHRYVQIQTSTEKQSFTVALYRMHCIWASGLYSAWRCCFTIKKYFNTIKKYFINIGVY